MKKYVVTVCETRQREIEVEAESAELAREAIKERWCQRGTCVWMKWTLTMSPLKPSQAQSSARRSPISMCRWENRPRSEL